MNWAGMGPDNPSSAAAIAAALGYTPPNQLLTSRVMKSSGGVINSTVGTTTEQAFTSILIPAGFAGANSAFEMDTVWETIGANGSVQLFIRIITGDVGVGLTGTLLVGNTLGTNFRTRYNSLVFNTNSKSSQALYVNVPNSFSGSTSNIQPAAIDTSAAWTIRINGLTVSALDQLALRHYRVSHHPGVPTP